eukprot:CAMPEP_0171771562 /NCGR_PEP_ID=MMETSP0991-20121206/54166_1 /TAXON_ID=483369 /ORGANISM="non described non described, Strain CCMP2098" /LENGTH=702 /DNA_ID=CAMNT_0012376921 /DNA_START=220 /DNA_END=2328 /DNA_ORIENTATION=+
MIQFTIPEGAISGSVLQINGRPGEVIEFVVPEGALAGEVQKIVLPDKDSGLELMPPPPQSQTGSIQMQPKVPVNPMTDPRRPVGGYMKLRVVVPAFAHPGSIVTVQKPDGGAALFTVPHGAQPGDKIVISVPNTPQRAPPESLPQGGHQEQDTVELRVPRNAVPGSSIQFRLADGRAVNAVVPGRSRPGDRLTVQVPRVPRNRAGQHNYNTISQNSGDENNAEVGGRGGGGGGLEVDVEAPRQSPKDLFDVEDYPNGDSDVVFASLNTGLMFNELVQVVWRKRDTVFRCDMATIGPALFEFLDVDGDGAVTVDEVLAAMGDEQLMDYVNSVKCPILTRLFHENEEKMRKSFRKIDTSKTGDIDFEEWMSFLGRVQRGRLNFYQRRFLLQDRVYAGLGMEPGAVVSEHAYATFGFVRGFWEDFKFYANNNHPLFVMANSHRLNPFSQQQRRAEFAAAFLTTFLGAGILTQLNQDSFVARIGFSVLCCTIPTAIYRKIAYYLFVAPCCIHDKSKASFQKNCFLSCCSGLGACLGYICSCAWGVLCLAFGIVFWTNGNSSGDAFIVWAVSIAEFWFLWFVAVLLVDFNPFQAVPRMLLPRLANKFLDACTCGVLPSRFGRWHLERDFVHGVVRSKVEERGIDRFFLPEQHSASAEEIRVRSTASKSFNDEGDENVQGAPEVDPESDGGDSSGDGGDNGNDNGSSD